MITALNRLIDPIQPILHGRYRWVTGFLCLLTVALVVFRDGSLHLLNQWQSPEFSHGPLIPIISFYLLWRSRFDIESADHRGKKTGLAFLALAFVLLYVGNLSTVYSAVELGLVIATIGLFYVFIGHGGMFFAVGPLVHLFLMIPVPDLIYNSVSQKLQLISSELGVGFIRLFNIPVFLEGNMIDLGTMDLQVAEACNGLRYAYPLTSIAYVIAFSFNGPIWKKLLIIASAIPLAIFMNALRIGITGLLVDAYGIEAAQGFLHYFEGWVIFILCLAVLFGLVSLFGQVFGPHKTFMHCLAIDPPTKQPAPPVEKQLPLLTPSAKIAGGSLLIAGLLLALVPERTETIPVRVPLIVTPDKLGDWRGMDVAIDTRIIQQLRLTDYKLTRFSRPTDIQQVELYISYYESQRKGAAVHSPAACIPAGGWEIASLTQTTIAGVGRNGEDLPVNRVLIRKGHDRQLVYYWFDQRGEIMTSALQVKLSIFWDALTRGRTDGAMVRLAVDIPRGQSEFDADNKLADFARHIYPAVGMSLPQ